MRESEYRLQHIRRSTAVIATIEEKKDVLFGQDNASFFFCIVRNLTRRFAGNGGSEPQIEQICNLYIPTQTRFRSAIPVAIRKLPKYGS